MNYTIEEIFNYAADNYKSKEEIAAFVAGAKFISENKNKIVNSKNKQFEYNVVEYKYGDKTPPDLNKLGRDGWELCSTILFDQIARLQYILKREIIND